MPGPSRPRQLIRSVVAWSLSWGFAAALYLLLIDITDLPELIVGAGAAVIAATAFELARQHDLTRLGSRLSWAPHLYRPPSGSRAPYRQRRVARALAGQTLPSQM